MSDAKNILVLTSIYPADDIPKGWTPVVHYFTREWVKQGHRVLVINYQARFPDLYYIVAGLFQKKITSKVGYTVMTSAVDDKRYEIDSVPVYRICLKKLKPHGITSRKEMKRALEKTIDYCKEIGFRPDVITSHWANPQLAMMFHLKEVFHVRTCYIAHGAGHFETFGNKTDKYWDAVDVVGFRSAAIKRKFETTAKYVKPSFMCYSGIPAHYNDNVVERSYESIKSAAYVGTLIQRKYPTALVIAMVDALGKDFLLSYAGEGQEKESIKAEAERLGVAGNVRLLGRIERNEVIDLLDQSDLFIMISRSETYGLVYLEAMARGCITIASRDEGFDGIIEDGKNGFLCKAGDVEELTAIIRKIKAMNLSERKHISENAMATAKELTDERVAMRYLEALVPSTMSPTV